MKTGWRLSFAMLLVTATLVVSPDCAAAADQAAATTPGGPQLVCVSDRAVAQPGDRVAIRTWITDVHGRSASTKELDFIWTASLGSISGAAQATWRLPFDVSAADAEQASARLAVRGDSFGSATCEVVVIIAKIEKARATRSDDLLEARALLLPGKAEPPGYGLYSYLLFRSPPVDDEQRARYLRTLEAWLRIAPVEEMLTLHRSPLTLNLTLIPVRHKVDVPSNLSDPEQVAEGARRMLDAYDFANAQVLLQSLGHGAERRGPYLVSRMPASALEPVTPLVFDLSDTTPRLAADWVEAYCRLAAQESQGRKWSRVALTKLSLNMRNVVAVMAADLPTVLSSLGQIVRVLEPR